MRQLDGWNNASDWYRSDVFIIWAGQEQRDKGGNRYGGASWEIAAGAWCFCSLEKTPRHFVFRFPFPRGTMHLHRCWIEAPIRPGRCRFECSSRLRQLDFIPFHRSPPLSLTAIAEPNIVIMSHWSQFAGKFSNILLVCASNRLLSCCILLLLNCRRLVRSENKVLDAEEHSQRWLLLLYDFINIWLDVIYIAMLNIIAQDQIFLHMLFKLYFCWPIWMI